MTRRTNKPREVTVRLARDADQAELDRLAALDSATPIDTEALVAEADSKLIAAVPLESGSPIADPFEATADAVALLELRRAQLEDAACGGAAGARRIAMHRAEPHDDDLARRRADLHMINPAPYNAEAPPEALEGQITPTELHYVRSNFGVPDHEGTLEIGGAVANPIKLTLDDLRSMPATERTVTLECAGNGRFEIRPLPIGEPWGDYAVSTARWTGALLHDVLNRARPTADGVEVLFAGADHGAYDLQPVLAETDKHNLAFERALPLAYATEPAAGILIAYKMNGEPLGPDHGAPFRLIVPHWYAVASVKWLKRIDVLTEAFSGEFQTGHYVYEWPDRPHEPVTHMRVRARITDPLNGAVIDQGTYTVRGKAWSGTGPVTKVEISFTGEGDWHETELEAAKGPYQWQDWSFDWDANDVGRHTVRARATDAAGHVQPEVPPWNRLGYGNNAIEVIYVDVR